MKTSMTVFLFVVCVGEHLMQIIFAKKSYMRRKEDIYETEFKKY